jgi:hypothetical protein
VSGLEIDIDDLGTLTMSARELNRLEILGRVLERRLTQAQATNSDALTFGDAVDAARCRCLPRFAAS